MSFFKKPAKKIALRTFHTIENENEKNESMEVEEDSNDVVKAEIRDKKKDKKEKSSVKPPKSSLLSFDDEEDEGEAFQVKKSSFSRKIHKERKKNKSNDKSHKSSSIDSQNSNSHSLRDKNNSSSPPSSITTTASTTTAKESNYIKEIHDSDGFSIRLKNSNPENLILNGRAALCAGRDEMTSEDEEDEENEKSRYEGHHRFAQPDDIKFKLEAGAIPDAAMIHAARKRRQKAREEGEFISIEDKESEEVLKGKGKRNIREEDAEDSDEERVDMAGITGVKEREERREKFYSAQSDRSDDADSDVEMNEWENQQIRKGVTGAQLMSAQQESAFYILPSSNKIDDIKPVLTTAELLEQAYSQSNYEIAKHIRKEKKKEALTKSAGGIKTPQEILNKIREKLKTSRELNYKHFLDIDRFSEEFKNIKIDLEESEKNGPAAAQKYRYYQELKLYIEDLIECLNEKVPMINALEEKFLHVTSKYSKMLIERRRQDVRDQAKEITELKTVKKTADDEERVRRAAEREGRRNRRRRNREKLNMNEAHNDGMSSDDEVPDNESAQYRESLAQIKSDAALIFDDVSEEYCDLAFILQKFDEWKKKDLNAYKEAYIHLCLPKIVTIFIRWKMISWNPFLSEYYEDIEKMDWYFPLAMYGRMANESEETLKNDPDVFLIPSIVEKLILSKLNKIIEGCFDPLSTTQTLKLVKLLNQLSGEYPSLRITSKNLQAMFTIITDKMKSALDNDVFIPIFQKNADARFSFFQRQFYSGIKLFRNFISFQGIIADPVLKSFAISSLLNRYLLSAMRVSSPVEGIVKAQSLVFTLPRIWLVTADKSFIESMNLFVIYVGSLEGQLDRKSPSYADCIERLKHILGRLDLMVHAV